MPLLKKIILVLIIVFIGIQFIPVERTNPPINGEISAPAEIKGILEKSCYDCHSNKTNWPWYSYVAPVSFFVTSDTQNGRKHVNFTEWNKYSSNDKKEIIEECIEEIEEENMPRPIYTLFHPNAKLNSVSIKKLKDWAKTFSSVRFN